MCGDRRQEEKEEPSEYIGPFFPATKDDILVWAESLLPSAFQFIYIYMYYFFYPLFFFALLFLSSSSSSLFPLSNAQLPCFRHPFLRTTETTKNYCSHVAHSTCVRVYRKAIVTSSKKSLILYEGQYYVHIVLQYF